MKPNIIYIHSHDTGRFIQPYGAAVPTPNLQAFADGSVLFRQAFCANPTCSPSRTSLLTGQYPHVCGMLGLAHRGFEMKDYSHHLATWLGEHGYHSVLAGHQHEIPHGREAEMGYQEVFGDMNEGLEGALEFLKREDRSEPFFMAVGFVDAHREYPSAGPFERPDRIAPPPGIPDLPETRRDMAEYHAATRILDDKIGLVLETIRQQGLEENTLVMITTDHGIPFPGYKCTLTDRGIGVHLMMRFPKGLAAGKTIDGMVSQVDVFPTLCEAAGIPAPDRLQGTSLMPLVRGDANEVNEEIFSEVNYHAAYEPMRCVRTSRYKYIRRWSKIDTTVTNNCDSGLSKQVWMDVGWKERPGFTEALYDLILDPGEHCNRIDDPLLADVAADMKGRLQRYMESTNDPLLAGTIDAPPNAVVDPCE